VPQQLHLRVAACTLRGRGGSAEGESDHRSGRSGSRSVYAIVGGTSTLGVIFRVILPVAWPGVATVAICAFVQTWEEFLFALTLMTESDRKTVPVGLAGFFGEFTPQWNLVMTASVVSTLPTLVLFLIAQRKLVSDLAAGAVKQ